MKVINARFRAKRSLGGAILASVSRSFYLSIKILPEAVREPIGLAYLLARASDTIADTSEASAELRLKHLVALFDMIRDGPDLAKMELLEREIVPSDLNERELLKKLPSCFEWLEVLEEWDRKEIEKVLEKIIRGQKLDILRFPDAKAVRALQNPAELDEYTYLVAGCVGEFWTQICCRHIPGFARIPEDNLCALGVNFGKGLQLVNILRDMPADLRAGRCYLPMSELQAAGVDPAVAEKSSALMRPVFDRWLQIAVAYLDDGFRYIQSLSNWRVRIACILPCFIGMQTLILLSKKYPLATDERVKISRKEVHRLFFFAPVAALSGRVLRRRWAGLKKALVHFPDQDPDFVKK